MMHLQTKQLRILNNCLTCLVAAVALYSIVAPFWPQLEWWFTHDAPLPALKSDAPKTSDKLAQAPAPSQIEGERLFIPGLGLDETIHGGGRGALQKGVWRLPYTSTPDKGGNTVLVGHRFTYSGQAVFYHLDKVQLNEVITVAWQGKLYRYKVFDIRTVPPTEVSVEANTSDPQLTIYTCTPLLTAKNRLVIRARPVGGV